MKAVYTVCDYKAEKQCQESLLKVEKVFRDYHFLLTEEINKQREIIDKLWVDAQRYLILKKSIPCFAAYPKLISDRAEKEILTRAHDRMIEIRKSNGTLQCSLFSVEKQLDAFDKSTKCIDYRTDSPFIRGSPTHKPIFYYMETVHDIYTYFRKVLAKLKVGANIISPSNVTAIETYKRLLEPSEELDEYVKFFLCVCKRTKFNSKE